MTLNEFFASLEREVRNHSIYVWGGGGQMKPTITEEWIKKKENSSANAKRAIAFWKKQVAAGYGDVLRAFDCSGLGTYCLGKSKSKANTMMGWTKKITRAELKAGDWVFRTDSGGKATHIGYVVDSALNVIESKGRDDGVVKRALNASGTTYWNRCGRPSIFADEINGKAAPPAKVPAEPAAPPAKVPSAPAAAKPPAAATPPASGWTLARVLKTASPLMKGDDVKAAQNALIKANFSVGKAGADGVYGSGTVAAVKAYQKSKKLTVDGALGKNTCAALGGVWKG